MKINLKSWEIQIGKRLWLVLSEEKPVVKKSKMRGKKFDTIIIDELINNKHLCQNQ